MSLHGKCEDSRDRDVQSVKKEGEKFGDIVKEYTNDVCGMRHVGGQRRNRIECGLKVVWW